MQTIDVTPTWRAMLPALLALVDNPSTHREAVEELCRMAEAADKWNTHVREKNNAHQA